MVIIITGATHTGKTLLAQRIMEEYHIPYFSMDHLKMGLIRSQNTNISVDDDEKLTNYLWPIVREMIKTAIENKQSLIVEGCYIPLNWKNDFKMNYLKHIEFICLCMTSEYIENNYDVILKKGSIIESRLEDDFYTKELLLNQNKFYYNGCKENQLYVQMIESEYEVEINKMFKTYFK